jgi:two-component system sensor histidine kinase AtoS
MRHLSKPAFLSNFTKPRRNGLEPLAVETLLNNLSQATLIVNSTNLQILSANIQASGITTYPRTNLRDLTLNQLILPPEGTDLKTFFAEAAQSDIRSDLDCELIRRNGNKVAAFLSMNRLGGTKDQYMVTLVLEEDQKRESLATQRQLRMWSDLNHLLDVYTQPDLNSAIQQSLVVGASLSGSESLSLYQAEGHSPGMRQVASFDPNGYLPVEISPQDFGQLTKPILWVSGKRHLTTLHREALVKKLNYLASAPIGQENAMIGIITVAGVTSPPNYLIEIVQFLANLINMIIQSHTLASQLQFDLRSAQVSQLASELVFDSIEDGLIFLTPDLVITELNTAAELALGYSTEEVEGQSIRDVLICNENLDTTFRFAQDEQRSGSVSSLRLYRRSGDLFLGNLRVLPIINESGVQSILIILHDLSEQEEYKTRNRQLEQRATLADITASFAHEVRNPINNISTGLQLLALKLPPDDPNQENISRLENDCERLADLVKSGLSFVRPVEYKLEPVDLGRLITNLMERWRNRISKTKVQYNPQIDSNTPPVEGDFRALEQVFTNLVDNAIQAMEHTGGTLTINIRQTMEGDERSQVEVSILDTGPGIPPDAKDHIFEPFYTTKRTGTGLGLAIVKRIVTAHKGSIHVNSIPGGTMFQVRLPCSKSL